MTQLTQVDYGDCSDSVL